MPPSDSFTGQQALVTGGTSGIGRAIALALADAGCQVTATGRSPAEVEAARRDCAGHVAFDRLEFAPLDVTDHAAMRELVGRQTRLDILVNAAGVLLRQGAEFQPEGFEEVVSVNLLGAARLCLACHPLLAAQGGSIINLASMLSIFGSGQVPAYSASKGGVAQLTRSLAIAWAPQGIRVNALAPGWIATAMTQPLQDDPERSRDILSRTPMARWGQPDEVAGAAIFLCSPAAAFITGVVLPVDGGYSIR